MAYYVAALKVERVKPPVNSTEKRDVQEVTHMTLKADTLEGLIAKLIRHISIVGEG